MSLRPTIICLTPVKNEAWILNTFLQCTSLWADHILIADQGSTDGSREIALKFPKVRMIHNSTESYNENTRQQILLREARKINGKRLLIALDSDEIFTSDFMATDDWKRILDAKPGEVFGFRWINICRNLKEYWKSEHFGWAFMDDGSEHEGSFIHSPRVPIKNPEGLIKLEQIKVLHYQFVNWNRMQSKHRYYQCLERINYPEKSPVSIYRMYHHMYKIKQKWKKPLEDTWFRGYEQIGISVREFLFEETHWYDKEILNFFFQYGSEMFKRESIWDEDWQNIARSIEFNMITKIDDPRNLTDRLIHFWLALTQRYSDKYLIRKADSFLNRIWKV